MHNLITVAHRTLPDGSKVLVQRERRGTEYVVATLIDGTHKIISDGHTIEEAVTRATEVYDELMADGGAI